MENVLRKNNKVNDALYKVNILIFELDRLDLMNGNDDSAELSLAAYAFRDALADAMGLD